MVNYDDWVRREAATRQAETALNAANREALFDVLTAAGITAVTVDFDGHGDEGQIEAIQFYRDEDEISAPSIRMDRMCLAPGTLDRQSQTMSLSDAVEQIAYDLLYDSHSGWEDSDGAFGDFRFEVGTRSIVLSFNERFTATEHYQHTF